MLVTCSDHKYLLFRLCLYLNRLLFIILSGVLRYGCISISLSLLTAKKLLVVVMLLLLVVS